jgi:hypothetical protein
VTANPNSILTGQIHWHVSELLKLARYMDVPLAVILDGDPVTDDSAGIS